MSIAIVGMLDEREEALKLIREQITLRGYKPCLIDISVGNGAIVPVIKADVSCGELVELATKAAADTKPAGDRKSATSVTAEGLKIKIASLYDAGELEGIIAITGMTGALITLPAMKLLPFGVPKLLISGATAMPIHASQFANYFALRDITVMHSVVDTVGMNALVRKLALSGANAICGMVESGPVAAAGGKKSVAITEFGFCDRGAHYVREFLGEEYEVVSFHATGLGDMAFMDLVAQGLFNAVIDLVPGAFTEHLLGGNRGIAGPNRLDMASALSVPYILCPGGFDIISCGPMERKDQNDPLWTSRKLAARRLYVQDPPRVQARINAEEMELIGRILAEKLNRYEHKGRVKVVIPTGGFSSLSAEGGPLYDPATDGVLVVALKKDLDPQIEVLQVDSDINSPQYARVVVQALSKSWEAIGKSEDSSAFQEGRPRND